MLAGGGGTENPGARDWASGGGAACVGIQAVSAV